MRQVSTTNLYKNLSAELSDLPFEVTRNGAHVAWFLQPTLEALERNAEMPHYRSSLKMGVYLARHRYCEHCWDNEAINVHHINHFAHGGLEENDNYVALCKNCHNDEHKHRIEEVSRPWATSIKSNENSDIRNDVFGVKWA